MASIEEITRVDLPDVVNPGMFPDDQTLNLAPFSHSILSAPDFVVDDENGICAPYVYESLDIKGEANPVVSGVANFSWGFHEGIMSTAGAIYGLAGTALDITVVPVGDVIGLDGDIGYNGVDLYPGVFEAAQMGRDLVPVYLGAIGAEDPGQSGLVDQAARIGGNVTASVVTGGAAYKATLNAGHVGYTALSTTQQAVTVPVAVGVLTYEGSELINAAPGIAVAGYDISAAAYAAVVSPEEATAGVIKPQMDNVQTVFMADGQIYDQIATSVTSDRVASDQSISFAGVGGAAPFPLQTASCISDFAKTVADMSGLGVDAVHNPEVRQQVLTSFAVIMDEHGDDELMHCGVVRAEDRAAITGQFVSDTGAVLNHFANTLPPPTEAVVDEVAPVNAAFSK